MEKSNLVIDKEREKVFLNGEIIGSVTGLFSVNCMVRIHEENVNRLNKMTIIDFFNNDVDDLRFTLGKNFFIPFEYSLFGEVNIIFLKESNFYIKIMLNNRFLAEIPLTERSFYEKLNKSLSNHNLFEIESEQMDYLEFGFEIGVKKVAELMDIPSLFFDIKKSLKHSFRITFFEIEQGTKTKLSELTNTFTFPPEIQSSCEQYLIYFATFLRDIGINAETNIESKAHKTLFTVIPKDGEEALDKIKEALQMYLSLPESPEFETVASEFTDVGVQQLASQVYFLKSQLLMANSAIQMKDATIQSLNMTNYQQTSIIESHQTNEKNEEEIAGGLVKVGEVKVPGFTFDLAELLRRIKRKFKM